ncbi:MAG: hypothetical protein M5U34_14880 [Chloroflexi bacterium]|nr:hypothetical protein [Chloroflexota bacterium]
MNSPGKRLGELVKGMAVWTTAVSHATDYTTINWQNPSAIIIGSEAHGAGSQAQALAAAKLTIPMQTNTESLNAAIAAAIILFEAVRQRKDR